ncbi:hypothetical protein CROQUDRAFT_91742 [Cronartium quercuum f. sp. fusiforme G11]|uniref:Uncharacterized protein n=1 Tax=Cronartium quercuum f. sp. fusiforme G11 TaxID=708437 RepID=A0A9P6TCY0_9BASI|nr:hypothetical protein CROQUDRAFT_91742 [Cronartium quercuum f. sp. fusiforme G11]
MPSDLDASDGRELGFRALAMDGARAHHRGCESIRGSEHLIAGYWLSVRAMPPLVPAELAR